MRQFYRNVFVATGCLIALTCVSRPSAGADTHVVHSGESIQAAVDAASPGDTVIVRPGTYRESIRIHTDGLTLRGHGPVTIEAPQYGSGQCYLAGHVAGFCILPADFNPGPSTFTNRVRDVTITGFRISGFNDGIFGFGTLNMKVSHVLAVGNSEYGIASFDGIGTTFTRNAVSGSEDAGIYVGDSPDARALVAHNRSWDNALGVLVRHAHNAVLFDNQIWENCLGILLLDDGQSGGSGDNAVLNNAVRANNRQCPGGEGFLPDFGGGGIVLAGSQRNAIFQNLVTDNQGGTPLSGGIVLVKTTVAGAEDASIGNLVVLNRSRRNEPADIVTDPASASNIITANRCGTSSPDGLCGF
jgi:hypothetical protein